MAILKPNVNTDGPMWAINKFDSSGGGVRIAVVDLMSVCRKMPVQGGAEFIQQREALVAFLVAVLEDRLERIADELAERDATRDRTRLLHRRDDQEVLALDGDQVSALPDGWEVQFFGTVDAQVADGDPDADGNDNEREFEDACTVCQSMGAQLAAPSTAFKQHLMAGFVDADHARGACACAVTHARVL